MAKKLFALAGFTALTGLVFTVAAAGCSSSTTTSGAGDDDSGNAGDVKKDVAKTDSSGDDDSGPATCPTTDPVDPTQLSWKSPTPSQDGKCTQDDITAMNTYLTANPTASNADFEAFIKTKDVTCHDCMFGDANGATWPPVPESGGTIVTLNIGACYSIESGNDGCGKAIQNEFDCEFVACADCTDDTALDACRKKAQTGACKTFAGNIQTGCNGVAATIDDICGSFFDSVQVQCVSKYVDGGPDSGI